MRRDRPYEPEEERHQPPHAWEQVYIDAYLRRHEPAPIPKLADRECRHGRLPGDRVRECDCWT